MTIEEAMEVLKQDLPCENDTDLTEAMSIAIKSLEADRTIEKTLYAIREEMQYIKVAEQQIYGANSWRFTNAIEAIINKHLEEVENEAD